MPSTITRVLVSAALSAQAIWISAQVDIMAARLDAQTWNYSLSSSWPGANEYPVYFSIPLGDGVLLDTSVIALPTGFQVYGTRSQVDPSLVTSFAVSAHEDAVPADMPGQGQTISGFQFRTTVPTVLESGRVLFGIGRFKKCKLSAHLRLKTMLVRTATFDRLSLSFARSVEQTAS